MAERSLYLRKEQKLKNKYTSTPSTFSFHTLEKAGAKKLNITTFRKGDNTMKKICIMMVTVILMCVALTGCNSFKQDDTHATVSLTTSTGQSFIGQSFNGAGMTWSGQKAALHYKSELTLLNGETATLTFKCDACGNEQTYEVTEAFSEMLHCDCPEEIDENGNAREYFAICISFKDEE